MRPITPEDCEGVASLIRDSFASLPIPVTPPPSALRVSADDIRAHLDAGGGGRVAGAFHACLLWAEHDGALHISRLAVAAAHRGKGVAAALLAEAEAEARRRGLPRLTLATRLAITGNRRLFARCGFVETTLHSHPGYTEPTFVDLEKHLPTPPPP